jgi:hypothetical protein
LERFKTVFSERKVVIATLKKEKAVLCSPNRPEAVQALYNSSIIATELFSGFKVEE